MQPRRQWGLRVVVLLGGLALSIGSHPQAAWANFQQQIRNNTVCSFIATRDVGGKVFVRQGPGTDFPVVATLKRGDGVRATRRQGNWVEIQARSFGYSPNETYSALQGWVNNQFINGCAEDEFERWRQ